MLEIYTKENLTDHLPQYLEEIKKLNSNEVLEEITKLKKELSKEITIVGHHYQQDDIIKFADITGDSLALAQKAAKETTPYIVFCGVHFMAETADILGKNQTVVLPDLNAGCSMADMANLEEVEKAHEFITSCLSEKDKIIPITYVNSSAAIKSFTGKYDGMTCTSSNAEKVIRKAFDIGTKLFFFPDQHLGRNTCYFKMGIPLHEMVIYDPRRKNGGLTKEQVQKAKVILWYGHCSVHQGFKTLHIEQMRKTSPKTKVIVHPECEFDVVASADDSGSTAYIIDRIKEGKPGDSFAVGTEINLVSRLQKLYPELEIKSLSPYQCLCATMYRIRPEWLLASLKAIKDGNPINVIKVPEEIKHYSRLALERMLELS